MGDYKCFWEKPQESDCVNKTKRAQGCLVGQLSGDALGSLVEFMEPGEIARRFPKGVKWMRNGGVYNTIAGQPTDDSEMALVLARSLCKNSFFCAEDVLEGYREWLRSDPFDCGATIYRALTTGVPSKDSQANGAMMRVSPLGIYGANYDLAVVADLAMKDAALTHQSPICLQANALFAMAISHAIQLTVPPNPRELYDCIVKWAHEMKVDPAVLSCIKKAETDPPDDYISKQGWVLIAFQNALWQLLHAKNLENGVVDSVMRGGDTDTNAAICGALLGAVYGIDAVPKRWQYTLANCRPQAGVYGVSHPRPEEYWPVDAMDIAERLLWPEEHRVDLTAVRVMSLGM